jgi:hypothetical protein
VEPNVVASEIDNLVELHGKARVLTQVLADKYDPALTLPQNLDDHDMKKKEAEMYAALLPEAPNGKRRFIDYFVKMSKL